MTITQPTTVADIVSMLPSSVRVRQRHGVDFCCGGRRRLAHVRRLTHNHALPEWTCTTVRPLYHGLDELEASMQVHVHLENHFLFPRAPELAEDTR